VSGVHDLHRYWLLCFKGYKSHERNRESAKAHYGRSRNLGWNTSVRRHASTGRYSCGVAQERNRSQENSRGVFDSDGRTPGSGPSVQRGLPASRAPNQVVHCATQFTWTSIPTKLTSSYHAGRVDPPSVLERMNRVMEQSPKASHEINEEVFSALTFFRRSLRSHPPKATIFVCAQWWQDCREAIDG
jgi:hypothetical protein